VAGVCDVNSCRTCPICVISDVLIRYAYFTTNEDRVVYLFRTIDVDEFFHTPAHYFIDMQLSGFLRYTRIPTRIWISIGREYCGRYKVLFDCVTHGVYPYRYCNGDFAMRHISYDYIDGSCSDYNLYYVVGYRISEPSPSDYVYARVIIDRMTFRRVA